MVVQILFIPNDMIVIPFLPDIIAAKSFFTEFQR